jgi:hypothetical protein
MKEGNPGILVLRWDDSVLDDLLSEDLVDPWIDPDDTWGSQSKWQSYEQPQQDHLENYRYARASEIWPHDLQTDEGGLNGI